MKVYWRAMDYGRLSCGTGKSNVGVKGWLLSGLTILTNHNFHSHPYNGQHRKTKIYSAVLSVLGMENNFAKIAAHDEVGVKLQSIKLLGG